MARKKPASSHHKKNPSKEADQFPTMFFESVSAASAPYNEPNTPVQKRASLPSHTERLIWMWSGVGVVMVVVFLAWTRYLNANGILNVRAWFSKDQLIQQSTQSLHYYFDQQTKDLQNFQAAAAQQFSASSTLRGNTNASSSANLTSEELANLKQKITSLSTASASSSAHAAVPSSPTKK